MAEMVFKVRWVASGWVVEDGSQMGPFVAREQAADLAEGMASALRSRGEPARVVYEEPPSPPNPSDGAPV